MHFLRFSKKAGQTKDLKNISLENFRKGSVNF